jgi:thymidylate synthase (FAD)
VKTNSNRAIPDEELISPPPRLYVLSRPSLDIQELLRFQTDEGTTWERAAGSTSAEELIEFAGRVCYMSFGSKQSPRTNREYIENLMRQEHDSVLEHACWTFLLTGVSRAFTHQLVRHRVGFSFSQLSQQYHDEISARFVVPMEIERDSSLKESWLNLMLELRRGYESIQAKLDQNATAVAGPPDGKSTKELRRAIRSAARSVLPNATETKIVFTANGRALRHFLRVRGSIPGDLEMRGVSALIYSRIREEAPSLLSGFKLSVHSDSCPIVEWINPKVHGQS